MSQTNGERPAASRAAGADDYRNDRGRLKSRMIFHDLQGGFVGNTGHVWTIERDGKWSRQRYVVRNTNRRAEQNGRLSSDQIDELARVLRESDFLGLPETISAYQGANPHTVRLSFGTKETSLVLQPGQPLPKPQPGPAPPSDQDRMLRVVHALRDMLGAARAANTER